MCTYDGYFGGVELLRSAQFTRHVEILSETDIFHVSGSLLVASRVVQQPATRGKLLLIGIAGKVRCSRAYKMCSKVVEPFRTAGIIHNVELFIQSAFFTSLAGFCGQQRGASGRWHVTNRYSLVTLW